MPLSDSDRDLAVLASRAPGDRLLSGLSDLAVAGASYTLGVFVNGMTVYGQTVPARVFAKAIDAQNETIVALGQQTHGGDGWEVAAESIGGAYERAAVEDEEKRQALIERNSGGDNDDMSEEDARLAIRLRRQTLTLTEVAVFPPGAGNFSLPLIRIPVAHVAGWWIVPTDEEGKATISHPL
jgi:hypothetical protein